MRDTNVQYRLDRVVKERECSFCSIAGGWTEIPFGTLFLDDGDDGDDRDDRDDRSNALLV